MGCSLRSAIRKGDSIIIDFAPIEGSKIGELAAKFDIVLGLTPQS